MEPQSQPFDPERPPEHAFGRIHPITVPIKWAPTPKNPNRKARKFVTATTETWSVNGVGFSSSVNRAVTVNGIITLRIGPVDGEVVVRSLRPGTATDSTYYGVEFISDDLQSVARDLISIHLRHRPEPRPRSASPLDLEDPDHVNVRDWS